MIALDWFELGSFSSSTTACQLWPASTSGEYIAPTDVYLLPKSMNGIVWPGLYLPKVSFSAGVRVISGCWFRSLVSTPRKSMYWLVYFAVRNVNVGVFGNSIASDDAVAESPVNVPNRDSAMISGQRCAAQKGQNSPPMYRTCGLPVAPVS